MINKIFFLATHTGGIYLLIFLFIVLPLIGVVGIIGVILVIIISCVWCVIKKSRERTPQQVVIIPPQDVPIQPYYPGMQPYNPGAQQLGYPPNSIAVRPGDLPPAYTPTVEVPAVQVQPETSVDTVVPSAPELEKETVK